MLSCSYREDHYTRLVGRDMLPILIDKACKDFSSKLHSLLKCLISPTQSPHILTDLQGITYQAATLARLIRLDTETIYYFPFIEKDSPFKPHDEPVTYFSKEHKEWIHSPVNRADVTIANPDLDLTEDKINLIHRYDPIIRIICSGAVETYRRGGWRPQDHDKGIRKRTLFPARVILRWGRPQEKSSLPLGYQQPKSDTYHCPASYMGFHESVERLGGFRDTIAAGSCRETRGEPWYLRSGMVMDPAWEVEGYLVLGAKGTG
jgi:hypothetical protein